MYMHQRHEPYSVSPPPSGADRAVLRKPSLAPSAPRRNQRVANRLRHPLYFQALRTHEAGRDLGLLSEQLLDQGCEGDGAFEERVGLRAVAVEVGDEVDA